MSKGVKIGLIVAIVIVALIVIGFIMAKYTTVGMSWRIDRLHDQIEARYDEHLEIYEETDARAFLELELSENRLLDSAEFDGDRLELCYVTGECEDYYLGIED